MKFLRIKKILGIKAIYKNRKENFSDIRSYISERTTYLTLNKTLGRYRCKIN